MSEEDNRNQVWVEFAVREIQAGRKVEEHFRLLFHHYEPLCKGLIASFGIREDQNDVVQEAMMRVYRSIGNFRLESSFDTWLVNIVKNVTRNAIRDRNTLKAKATRTSLDTLRSAADEEGQRAVMAEPESLDPDPLTLALEAEREAELAAVLEKLPRRMRQSMLLYYVHGYKQKEIAALQGTSVNTVKKQLVDARKRIRPVFGVLAELLSVLLLMLLLIC